jgi:hypothetical protein
MSGRPYFHKSIEQLRAIYDSGACQRRVLNKLLKELKHRSTASARDLRREVERGLANAPTARPSSNAHLRPFKDEKSTAGGAEAPGMTEMSARRILGVTANAPFSEIKLAWRHATGGPGARTQEEVAQAHLAYQFLERYTASDF